MASSVEAGVLLTAGALGLTHGIEPDHVAGITALTHEAGDPRLSALVGGCFAAGHAALVVLWIAIAYLLFGTTSFPQFEQVGLLVVGIVLSVLSLYLGITGTRKLIHKHSHNHGAGLHTHYHSHLARPSRHAIEDCGEHSHDHGVIYYLKIGTIGALFTLSPPVSMIAFISVMMAGENSALMTSVVAAYTVTIIVTMAIIGGGAGTVFRITKTKGERFHAISQVIVSVLILAFAISLLLGVVPRFLS